MVTGAAVVGGAVVARCCGGGWSDRPGGGGNRGGGRSGVRWSTGTVWCVVVVTTLGSGMSSTDQVEAGERPIDRGMIETRLSRDIPTPSMFPNCAACGRTWAARMAPGRVPRSGRFPGWVAWCRQ